MLNSLTKGFTLASAAMALCLCAVALGQTASQAAVANAPKASAPDEGFQFSDAPGFSIAGVTDYTAVGGHGSDAVLRTSEDLNRGTLALAAGNRTSTGTDADPEMEARLKQSLAADPGAYAANHALGTYYFRIARYREAIAPLTAALRLQPGNAEDACDLALAYRGSGNAAHARQVVQDVLTHSDAACLHRLAGELDEAAGDPVHAVQEEERAAHLDPSEENYLTWGSELLLHRAVWQASQVFARGVQAHPASARLHTAWGAALFSEAKYGEAAQRLCEAASLDPGAHEPYVFLGKAAVASPVPLPCAREKLEQFLRQQPDDAEANYYLAMVLLKQASTPDQQRAEALLQRSALVNPKYALPYLQLGVLATSRKSYPEAIAFLTKAVEADPQMGEAHFRLGVLYDRLGDQARAKQEYDLHEAADAADAARVEQQRRDVKQFLVTSAGQPEDVVTH